MRFNGCPARAQDYWGEWIEVYRRIQNANKAFCLSLPAKDLDLLFQSLDAKGVWISSVSGISNQHQGEAALEKISKWTKKR